MDPAVIVLFVVVIGSIVGLLAWFGPRPSQWRSHGAVEDDAEERVDGQPNDPDQGS